MALADYSTAAEKIAAFKCATLDPALVHLATADFVTDDTIYVITAGSSTDEYYINGNIGVNTAEIYGFNQRVNKGDAISSFQAMLYIKDSEIVYSNPVELYQERLARVLETDETYVTNNSSFVAGIYGSLIVYANYIRLQTGEELTLGGYGKAEFNVMIPIPAGQGILTGAYTYTVLKYFDVPLDW